MFKKQMPIFMAAALVMIPTMVFAQSNIDFFFKGASDRKDVLVAKVKNTDTIVLEDKTIVKLIGLRASPCPDLEREDPKPKSTSLINGFYTFKNTDIDVQIDSPELIACQYVQKLLEGKTVRLEFDVIQKDKEGQTLAYVFLEKDQRFVNADIIKNGYAFLSISPPNTKYEEELRNAYLEARENQRGLLGLQ